MERKNNVIKFCPRNSKESLKVLVGDTIKYLLSLPIRILGLIGFLLSVPYIYLVHFSKRDNK